MTTSRIIKLWFLIVLCFCFLPVFTVRSQLIFELSCDLAIDLFASSDAILKISSVDFCVKVKVNSDSSSKTVKEYKFSEVFYSRFKIAISSQNYMERVKINLVQLFFARVKVLKFYKYTNYRSA